MKYGLVAGFMLILCTTLHYVLRVSVSRLFSQVNSAFLAAYIVLEFYKTAVHEVGATSG